MAAPPLAATLADESAAAAVWQTLSYSKQRAHTESITSAKTDATRTTRVEKVLAALRG